jgi:hypothetical protein
LSTNRKAVLWAGDFLRHIEVSSYSPEEMKEFGYSASQYVWDGLHTAFTVDPMIWDVNYLNTKAKEGNLPLEIANKGASLIFKPYLEYLLKGNKPVELCAD